MAKRNLADPAKQKEMGRIGHRPYWVLCISIFIRAVHQIGAAVFLSAYLLGDPGPPSTFFMYLVFGSGMALIFTEWMRHRQIFKEFAGMATFMKLILIGVAFHGLFPIKITMVAGFVLASVCSHAPKLVRHRLLFKW